MKSTKSCQDNPQFQQTPVKSLVQCGLLCLQYYQDGHDCLSFDLYENTTSDLFCQFNTSKVMQNDTADISGLKVACNHYELVI